MKNYKIKHFCLPLVLAFLMSSYVNSQSNKNLATSDSSLIQGKLDNGFTYYIKPLKEPVPVVKVQLWVKAGAKQEGENQTDLAHFLEHLALKSSTHFPKGIRYDSIRLAKAGLTSISDINASTGFETTHYTFNAKPNNKDAIHTALLWFNDIAQGLKLTDEDIENERGVLVQEVNLRVQDLPEFLLKDKVRSKIIPCSNPSNIHTNKHVQFSAKEIRDFYKAWYRPDLMAIGIIGNIENPMQLKKQIEKEFGTIPVSKNKTPPPNCSKLDRLPGFAHAIRDEKNNTEVRKRNQLYLGFRDKKTLETLQDFEGTKQLFLWQSITQVLQNRLNRLQYSYDVEYDIFNKHTYNSAPLFSFHSHNVLINFADGQGLKALKVFLKQLKQLKDFGVHPKEWDVLVRQQNNILDKQDTESVNYWSMQMYRHFESGQVLSLNKKDQLQYWWNTIDITAYNQKIKDLIKLVPEDIGVIANNNSDAVAFTEKKLRGLIDEFLQQTTKAYVLKEWNKPILSDSIIKMLEPREVKRKENTQAGGKKFVFENGTKLIFHKDTTAQYTKGSIQIHAFNPIGSSCFSEKERFSVLNSSSYIRASGMGNWDKFDFDAYLKQQKEPFRITPYITPNETGIKGKASLTNIEDWFQMMYMYFTQPRYDTKAFAYWKRQKDIEFTTPYGDMKTFNFKNRAIHYMGQSNLINIGAYEAKGVKQTTIDVAYNGYKELFSQTEGFTFVVMGNIEEEQLLAFAQKYIGNLPRNEDKLSCNSVLKLENKAVKYPQLNELNTSVENAKETLYMSRYILPDLKPYSEKYLGMFFLRHILDARMMDLRYKKKFSIYVITSNLDYDVLQQNYTLSFMMNCKQEEVEGIRREAKNIIEKIKDGNLTQNEFEVAKKRTLGMLLASATSRDKLLAYYKNQGSWINTDDIVSIINQFNKTDIINLAKLYLDESELYEFAEYN